MDVSPTATIPAIENRPPDHDVAPETPVAPDSTLGLTSDEARRRLKQGGANAIADVAQHPVRRALEKLWAPVPWMLEAAILLQLGLGEYVEASVVAFLLV